MAQRLPFVTLLHVSLHPLKFDTYEDTAEVRVRGNRERDVTWYRTKWGCALAIQGRQLCLLFTFF
jgi:hypothetical protein